MQIPLAPFIRGLMIASRLLVNPDIIPNMWKTLILDIGSALWTWEIASCASILVGIEHGAIKFNLVLMYCRAVLRSRNVIAM